mgnify:CR=1 FL=1
MIRRTIASRLTQAKSTLSQTMESILDINRRRKTLPLDPSIKKDQEQALSEELKILNKLAEQQAVLIRKYEMALTKQPSS